MGCASHAHGKTRSFASGAASHAGGKNSNAREEVCVCVFFFSSAAPTTLAGKSAFGSGLVLLEGRCKI